MQDDIRSKVHAFITVVIANNRFILDAFIHLTGRQISSMEELSPARITCKRFPSTVGAGLLQTTQGLFTKRIYFGTRNLEFNECNLEIGIPVFITYPQSLVGSIIKLKCWSWMGEWCSDRKDLKSLARNNFVNLYGHADLTLPNLHTRPDSCTMLQPEEQDLLIKPVQYWQTTKAIRSIKPHKVPDQMGFSHSSCTWSGRQGFSPRWFWS